MSGPPPGVSQESMMQQAQHIWSMLDDMAAHDPSAYKKFVDKQITDGKESMKPPDAHMCVQTTIYSSSEGDGILFINMMQWSRIPEPKTDQEPIPVMGGSFYQGKDSDGTHKLVAVAFNPTVLTEFGIDSGLVEERRMLVNLAIDYLEDQHKLKISRNYTLLQKHSRCKGPLAQAQKSLMTKTKSQDAQFEQELGEIEKTFGPAASGCKDSLLHELSNIAVGSDPPEEEELPQSFRDSAGESGVSRSEIRLPGTPLKGEGADGRSRGLVEVLTSEEVQPVEPTYDLRTIEEDGQKPRRVVLKINLPEVAGVADCDLDISQEDVHLVVGDRYELRVDFPARVKEDAAKAKFSRKSCALTLTIPCQQPS